jgi:hypothetical protein
MRRPSKLERLPLNLEMRHPQLRTRPSRLKKPSHLKLERNALKRQTKHLKHLSETTRP